MAKKLITYKIVNKSGIKVTAKHIEVVKSHSIIVLEGTVGGDAPKDLIRLYNYGKGRKNNPKTWKKYIAKIGHKWYPNESITEHYLTVVGKCFGINIANSKVIIAEDYVRYLSEHFHDEEQTLNHGANILSRFINEENNEWIDELDKNKVLKKEISIVDVLNAIKKIFPEEHSEIFNNFFHMLLFDALTGNNDRHYYNWGVISHIKNQHRPYFSPIYDTARGLLWNQSDENVISLQKEINNPNNKKLKNYVLQSVPKISVPDNVKCNHFELIEFLENKKYFNDEHKSVWTNPKFLDEAILKLNSDFKHLFIKERKEVIQYILDLRFKAIAEILNKK
ncbi:hypothetical protein G7A72_03545 [Flavobacterium sp. Sr18]|uniref:HipA domain-containing protein n=1 Tax=Flavobacterium sp. Sr18 TaxID=935222 RepID=UPI0013E43F76|nr:HipA domain-containing protein [Flavobacterium sp. Sr18]QIH37931.1 hypothetical protein G7A72_03545 [Flavobacterium sp. Sr18]